MVNRIRTLHKVIRYFIDGQLVLLMAYKNEVLAKRIKAERLKNGWTQKEINDIQEGKKLIIALDEAGFKANAPMWKLVFKP